MTTPEHPDSPPLTRRQMRDIRNTGATPIVDADAAADAAAETAATEAPATPITPPLPRAAEPFILPEPPGPDLGVDLGVSPLTRRQARQQERIRTASVPVITPEVAAAHAASLAAAAASAVEPPAVREPSSEWAPAESASVESAIAERAAAADETPVWPFSELGMTAPVQTRDDRVESSWQEPRVEERPADGRAQEPAEKSATIDDVFAPTEAEQDDESADPLAVLSAQEQDDEDEEGGAAPERAVVNSGFGAGLLAGKNSAQPNVDSFDDLITRSTNGSAATPNALILSQSPDVGSMVAPLTGTGEVLITGIFNLPEGLGSTGHAPGTNDGKEVDAVLVDGELPAHSSPTPIAASAAVSTVKMPGEIIKPPAPEKGGRLMMTLAITAGVLALALVGVLILAFATGVFS